MVRLVIMLISMSLLCGCALSHTGRAENPIRRNYRQQYLANTPNLAPEIKAAIMAQQVIPGMSRSDVTAAWGPPTSCSRTYGDASRETICLYSDSTTIIGGTTTYTDRRYKSVYFQNGVAVDWQWH